MRFRTIEEAKTFSKVKALLSLWCLWMTKHFVVYFCRETQLNRTTREEKLHCVLFYEGRVKNTKNNNSIGLTLEFPMRRILLGLEISAVTQVSCAFH